MLDRKKVLDMMMDILKETMLEEGSTAIQEITTRSPLLAGAIVTSIGLVSVVTEIEMRLDEEYGVELTLVSEEALSRKRSPFQHLEALADYVFELAGLLEGEAIGGV